MPGGQNWLPMVSVRFLSTPGSTPSDLQLPDLRESGLATPPRVALARGVAGGPRRAGGNLALVRGGLVVLGLLAAALECGGLFDDERDQPFGLGARDGCVSRHMDDFGPDEELGVHVLESIGDRALGHEGDDVLDAAPPELHLLDPAVVGTHDFVRELDLPVTDSCLWHRTS